MDRYRLIASIVVLIVFRAVPSKKLWDNYTVLYVPADTVDELVINDIVQDRPDEMSRRVYEYYRRLYFSSLNKEEY